MPAFKKLIPWGVLAALLAVSLYNHFSFSLRPLYVSRGQVPAMIMKSDIDKLEVLAPDLFKVVAAIRTFPPAARFYFVPCFDDSGNTGRWWWYVHLLTRYLCYPRIIFAHDKIQYDNSKTTYLARFIKEARTWQEVDWVDSRQINVIILMRNDLIRFMRTTDPIGDL